MDHHTALALLKWQIELGATEAICDAPISRYDAPAAQPVPVQPAPLVADAPAAPADPQVGAVAAARASAARAHDLVALRAAMAEFEHCDMRRGARNLVFADGQPGARVMVIADAPTRDEDQAARPFVGQAGGLFDRMFAAIGLDRAAKERADALYIVPAVPWRPTHPRGPAANDIAMLRPFLERHIALAAPEYLVLMGNLACQMLLGRDGITRLRGQWADVTGLPALPIFPPDFLLREPIAKREAWADLLSLRARLDAPETKDQRHEPD